MPDAYDYHDSDRIVFRRRRLAGDVISDSLAFVRENFHDFGRGLLYIAGPVLLLAVILSASYQREAFGMNPFLNPDADPEAIFSLFGPAYFVTVLLMLVGTLLVTAVGYAYVLLYVRGEQRPITVPMIWDEVKAILLPLVTTNLGLGLLYIVSMLIMIIPCLGALAWLAGLIYLAPALVLVLPARLTDEDGLFDAIRRARHLVQGYWGQTFGVLVMAVVLYIAIAMVASIPTFALMGFAGFSGAEDVGIVAQALGILGSLVGMVGYGVMGILSVVFMMQYYNLVERQEGTDLDDEIDAMARRGGDAVPHAASAREYDTPADETPDADRWQRPYDASPGPADPPPPDAGTDRWQRPDAGEDADGDAPLA